MGYQPRRKTKWEQINEVAAIIAVAGVVLGIIVSWWWTVGASCLLAGWGFMINWEMDHPSERFERPPFTQHGRIWVRNEPPRTSKPKVRPVPHKSPTGVQSRVVEIRGVEVKR